MKEPVIQVDETERLGVLHRLNLLDTSTEKVFDNITELASEICGTKISLISLVDEDRVWFKSAKGFENSETPRKISFCAHTLQTPDALMEVEDALEDDRFFDNPLTTQEPYIRFYAGAPLVYEDDLVIGTLCVIDKEPMMLSEAQKSALRILAQQVVELIRLHEANQETIRLKSINEGYSNRLDTIVNSVADIIYELDEQGRFTFVNDTLVRVLGYSREELQGMTCWELILKMDQKTLWSFYKSAIDKQLVDLNEPSEYRIRTKNGKTIRFRQKVKFHYEGERVVKVYAVATDITSLYKAEKDGRESFKKYKLLADSATDLVALNQIDGTYQFLSPSLEAMFGYREEEVLGKKPYDFLHPEDIPNVKGVVYDALKEGREIKELKFRMRHKEGHYRWLDTHINPIRTDGVVAGFRSTSRDITEKVEKEAKLSLYYQNLDLLNDLTSSVQLDLKDQLTSVLKLTCNYLKLPIGIISDIRDREYTVKYKSLDDPEIGIAEDDQYELGNTYCELVFAKEETVYFDDVEDSKYQDHPCHSLFGLKAYMGAMYSVDGNKRGTINFSSPTPQDSKFDPFQLEFVEIVASQVGFLISIEEKESKLRNERNLLKSFVKESPAALAMLDSNMNYLASSDSCGQLNGIVNETQVGKNHYDLFPEETAEWREIHKKCLKGYHLKRKEELVVNNGKQQWLRWEITPWYIDEETIGGIIMWVEDISVQKNQQKVLRRARDQAEEASELKQNFLSTMSHEIRTPLNSIIGFSNLLLRDKPREDQMESLSLLKFSGENLLYLIDNILDISKIQAGKIELENIDFDLHHLVSSIQHALAIKADEKQIGLTLDYDSSLPRFFEGDKGRLAQILNNLISNAIKFTNEGKVAICITQMESLDGADSVKFEIRDTGIGIPESKQDAVFEAFSQASKSNTRLYGGTGLGLTISKSLVDIMGGELEVQSEESQGSNFYFTLMMNHGEGKVNLMEDASENIYSEKIESKGKILLVEDNQMNQLIATNFIGGWGLSLDVAKNGLEAVEMVKAFPYELILMDLQMPEMDGYDASKIIRKMEGDYFHKVPIIALTASAIVEIKDEIIAAGLNDYISKPYDPKELKNKLIKYLSM